MSHAIYISEYRMKEISEIERGDTIKIEILKIKCEI